MSILKKTLLVTACILVIGSISLKALNNYFETIIDLNKDEKIEDFNYLYQNMKDEYPFLFEVKELGYDIDNLYEKYLNDVKSSKTDIEYFKCIDAFIKEFQGLGHLMVLDGTTYQYYMETLNEYSRIEEMALSNSTEDYEIEHISSVLNNVKSSLLYSGLDVNRDGFRSQKGQKKKFSKREEDMDKDLIIPNVYTEIKDSGQLAYLKIDSFTLENYEKDKEVINAFFKTISDCDALLIDISDNPGGSDKYWKELIVQKLAQKSLKSTRYFLSTYNDDVVKNYIEGSSGETLKDIEKLPIKETVNKELLKYFNTYYSKEDEIQPLDKSEFKSEVFILTSPTVYSASDNFVGFSKNSNFATTIGKSTSGDGGLDPYLFSLPNSGLIIRFSIVHGINNDGSNSSLIGTTPDIIIEHENILESALEYVLRSYND